MATTVNGDSGIGMPSGIGSGSGNGLFLGAQYFTTAGTSTYTPTTGTNFVVVEVIGGGGGGGGTTFSTTNSRAGHGGGGGYARKEITSSFSGVTITVGAGGSAGTNGTTGGTNGGTSSFGALVSATGGTKGTNANDNGLASSGAGGAGSSGDLNLTGSTIINSSGATYFPFAIPAMYGTLQTWERATGTVPSSPIGYGAGGGGSFRNSAGSTAGSAGTDGLVIVYEYS